MSKTLLIVDDHPIICGAITAALERNGYTVVATSTDGVDALLKIRTLSPEYLLLDIGLDGLDGLSVLQRLNSENIKIKTLVFTSQAAGIYAARCMQAGASGFINKSATMDELIKGFDAINDGYLYFPREALDQYVEHGFGSELDAKKLTNKEIIILQLLVQGLSNVAIGEQLFLSHKTVSGHKINILRKLGVRTTIELASVAKEMNLI
ncbi:response regulator transcription factor [Pseudomonas sp. UFMG81]|uniref:response regulator transcription factor n=1 Tax=Pseudomonas sp. UFMG81 TaxID=2745936 RepID=UPI00188F00D7|nr:response regulator transcription factor [Pseudomonas sp. UFMG81]